MTGNKLKIKVSWIKFHVELTAHRGRVGNTVKGWKVGGGWESLKVKNEIGVGDKWNLKSIVWLGGVGEYGVEGE